jgi:hypothetical protein
LFNKYWISIKPRCLLNLPYKINKRIRKPIHSIYSQTLLSIFPSLILSKLFINSYPTLDEPISHSCIELLIFRSRLYLRSIRSILQLNVWLIFPNIGFSLYWSPLLTRKGYICPPLFWFLLTHLILKYMERQKQWLIHFVYL